MMPRMFACLLLCAALSHLASGDENTLTATFADGKAESTKSTDKGTTTVLDEVTATSNGIMLEYEWVTENDKQKGEAYPGKMYPNGTAWSKWNTTSTVFASVKGNIAIQRWEQDCCMQYTIPGDDSTHTAQRWITMAQGGCATDQAPSDASGPEQGKKGGMTPREAAKVVLFGERGRGNKRLFRIESRLIDLTAFDFTGLSRNLGIGRHLVVLSVSNDSGHDAVFRNQADQSVKVKSGEVQVIFQIVTDNTVIEEVPQVYEVILDSGSGRQVKTSLRAHFWRARAE